MDTDTDNSLFQQKEMKSRRKRTKSWRKRKNSRTNRDTFTDTPDQARIMGITTSDIDRIMDSNVNVSEADFAGIMESLGVNNVSTIVPASETTTSTPNSTTIPETFEIVPQFPDLWENSPSSPNLFEREIFGF